MKKHLPYLISCILLFLFQSCATPEYFHDPTSYQRQKELKSCRSGNVFCDIMTGVGSVVAGAMLDAEVDFNPSDQQFKKLKLVNPTADTIYVNMLTDVYWDKENYCDFMDIRIPPRLNCKVLVPVEANYNLYFSNTPQNDDDELLQIFTSDIKKITLYPGLTSVTDN